jgi:AcrR family transcriptional regulator
MTYIKEDMNTKEQLPGTRIERRKEDTRRKVTDTAMRLFREHGFDAVTMEQIANEVDIAKGTLYNHFPVKEAILEEFVRRSFQERSAERIAQVRALPDTRVRMGAVLLDLISGIQRNPELFERYFSYRIRQMLALRREESGGSGFNELESEVIRLGQEEGDIRSDVPQSLLLALFEFTFVEIAQSYFTDPEAFDAQKVTDQCVELFMFGAHRKEKPYA